MNPLVLSGTSLNVWAECPREWWYAYVLAKQMPPSYKMALGVAAHEAVEWAFREWKTTGFLPTDADRWIEAFDASWFDITKDSRPKNSQPAESAEAHRRSGHQVVGFYCRQIAPTIDVVAFEEPMAMTINGHTWTGTLDLLDRLPSGGLRVRDHKFTSKKPNPDQYRRPMIGYYLMATARFGEIEQVQLDYIVRGNRDRPPTFIPILMEISKQDILDFATDVEEATQGIEAGRFPPLGNQGMACRWCPYRKVCKYVRTT